MIYCLPIEQYPKEGEFIEELSCKDENHCDWKIARIKNGFIIRYFDFEYFLEKRFHCELTNGQTVTILNTNCIFIQDTDFDTFCLVRDVIKNGFTDEIWDTFEEMFTERFEHDKGLLACEMA